MGKRIYVRSGGEWVDVTSSASVVKASSAPNPALEGQIYYNTTSHIFYVYNGTSWVNLQENDATWATTAAWWMGGA